MGGLPRPRRPLVVVTATAMVALSMVAPRLGADATPLTLCGNSGPAPGIQHVIIVMLENQSESKMVGNTTSAPYTNSTLTQQCGYATDMYGTTHYSAANYLGITAGTYPPESVNGCGYVGACDTAANNVFQQAAAHGLDWKAYEESMPSACYKSSTGDYSLGHNPVPFYTNLSGCASYDVPVDDLTAQSGPFWTDLQNGTLPNLSFVTPNDVHNGHDSGTGVPAIDSFLSQFVPLVQQSNTYQDGNTAVFVTFDEGNGGDKGQDCTNQTQDLAGNQESCHIPLFVLYPYTPAGPVDGFFDHYSVTRTVEELMHVPLLAGAATAPSLITPFHLADAPPPPTEYVANPGFENGTESGWAGIYTASSVTNPTQDEAYAGAWSLAISSSSTDATSAVGVTSKPPVITNAVAGTPLTGSVMVKATTPGINVTQMVWERAPDGSRMGYQSVTVTLQDTQWHQLKAPTPFTVRGDGDTILYSLYSKNFPAGGTLYADNFSLTSPS